MSDLLITFVHIIFDKWFQVNVKKYQCNKRLKQYNMLVTTDDDTVSYIIYSSVDVDLQNN